MIIAIICLRKESSFRAFDDLHVSETRMDVRYERILSFLHSEVSLTNNNNINKYKIKAFENKKIYTTEEGEKKGLNGRRKN